LRRRRRPAARAGLPLQITQVADLPFPITEAVRLNHQLELHPVRYLRGPVNAVPVTAARPNEDAVY
jgi:hypothetical protein